MCGQCIGTSCPPAYLRALISGAATFGLHEAPLGYYVHYALLGLLLL